MGMSAGSGDSGGGGHFNSSGSMMAEINVTPLVDVMLVLLIIFMVTAPLMQQGVEVSLPKARAQSIASDADTNLVVSVQKDGKIFMMSQSPMVLGELEAKLQAIVANNPNKQVLLKADKDVPYGTVAQVMAGIRRAGVSRLGMVTLTEIGNSP